MGDVTVRAFAAGDADGLRDTFRDAFGADGQRVADLADALLAGPARASLLAEQDGTVVGGVLLSRGWLDAPRRLVDVLVLSPLGVRTAHQRTGIGSALVRAALSSAKAQGTPLVFLEGSAEFYPRLGFERGQQRGFRSPSTRIPDAAFQVAVLPAWAPWMTGALVYCDVFWAFDCVGPRPG